MTLHVPAGFPTIQAAIDAASPGDTVAVAPGVYQESVVISKAIHLVGTHGAAATHLHYPSAFGAVVYSPVPIGAAIRGFTIRDSPATAILMNTQGTIADCVITGNTNCHGALWLIATTGSIIVERCLIANNAGLQGGLNIPPPCGVLFDGQAGGISTSASGTNAVTLKDCLIAGNVGGDAGVDFCGGPAYGAAGGVEATGLTILEGCTIACNKGGSASTQTGSLAAAGGVEVTYHGPVIHNSVIRNNVGGEFGTSRRINGFPPIAGPALPFDIRNSDVAGYSPSLPPFGPDTFIDNIDADPRFVDPVNGDYRLLPISPCIDTGDAAFAMSSTDLEGNSRVVGANVDMGMDEYVPVLPGTGEGLELLTLIDGAGASLDAKLAPGGSALTVEIVDDSTGLGGAVPVLPGAGLLQRSTARRHSVFPLWIDPAYIALFHDGNAVPGPAIGSMPVAFGPVILPPGLDGLVLRLQAFGLTNTAGNGLYAATRARDLWFD